MRIQLFTASLLLMLYCLAVTPPAAQAYLDPGTGSYVIQLLAGGLLAVGYTFRNFIANLLKPFLGKKKPEVTSAEGIGTEAQPSQLD